MSVGARGPGLLSWRADGTPCYALTLLAVGLLYIFTMNFSYRYHQARVPTGDPFTYTLSLYTIVDLAHAGRIKALRTVLSSSNWYWLQNLLVVILSPVLVKQPASLALINFVMFCGGLLALLTVLRRFGVPARAAFLLELVLWLSPMHYGFGGECVRYLSLLVLMLETSFFWMLFITALHLILYALHPARTGYAVAAAVFCGLALWGRGNSLVYVVILLSLPVLVIVWTIVSQRAGATRRHVCNLLVFLVVVGGMACWYYYFTWASITSYYSYLSSGRVSLGAILAEKLRILVHPPAWVVKNIPGIFLCSVRDGMGTCIISLSCHTLILGAAAYVFCRSPRNGQTLDRKALRLATAFGVSIYFATFLMGLLMGGSFTAHRPYHIFAPMLVGLAFVVVCALAPTIIAFADRPLARTGWFLPGLVCFCVVYGGLMTRRQTPLGPIFDAASPIEVERVALSMDSLTEAGSLAFLWYGVYNPPILDFYRSMKDLPPFKRFIPYYQTIFHTVAAQVDPQDFRLALRKTMLEADYVIIPEDLSRYAAVYPSAIKERGARELMDFLNAPDCPRYAIRMVLHDGQSIRLLLLKRLKEGEDAKGLALLPRPYGNGVGVAELVAHAPSDRLVSGAPTWAVPSAASQPQPGKQRPQLISRR
jgi:hypothetical protein